MTHDHATNYEHMVDHTKRYHEVFVHDNKIMTSHTYGLAYLDTNHAANDRTANSEVNPYLNAPHVHHTRAHVMGNTLDGAGILVDVFNASDERHKRTARGMLDIAMNEVSLGWDPSRPFKELNGIEVRNARDVRLAIASNMITGADPTIEELRSVQVRGAGVVLNAIDDGRVTITDVTVMNRRIGVQATNMTSSVMWAVERLRTSGVEQRIVYDGSVRNPPSSA